MIVSTYFTFEDVKVPVENPIGKENYEFKVFVISTFPLIDQYPFPPGVINSWQFFWILQCATT
jgi:hypothetical protein